MFEDYEAVKRVYFRRTGIFPIMHTVIVRKQLANDRYHHEQGLSKKRFSVEDIFIPYLLNM